MDTKRDSKNPFTRPELEAISDQAAAEGNELVQQMANVMLATESWAQKEMKKIGMLLDHAVAVVATMGTPDDSIRGRIQAAFKEMVEGLTHDDQLDTEVVKMQWDEMGLSLDVKSHWASQLVAAAISDTLKKPDGTWWNNVTYTMTYKGEQFFVQVQRVAGKTVKQQLNEAEVRVKELEAAIRAECAKFSFPDEDRPELFAVLNKKETP